MTHKSTYLHQCLNRSSQEFKKSTTPQAVKHLSVRTGRPRSRKSLWLFRALPRVQSHQPGSLQFCSGWAPQRDVALAHFVDERQEWCRGICRIQTGLKQFQLASAGVAGACVAGDAVCYGEIAWLRSVDVALLAHATLGAGRFEQQGVVATGFFGTALAEGAMRSAPAIPHFAFPL